VQDEETAMTEPRRHPHVVNIEEAPLREEKRGGFEFRARRLGAPAGARAIGCSYYELPAGKTAFPFHFHSAVEEAIFVIEGRGTLRLGDARVELRAGDYVALLPGPDAPHALTSGDVPMRYLCVSGPATPNTMDIVAYPDSKKIAFAAGIDPAKGMRGGSWFMKIVKDDQPSTDYYEGESIANES
jgi:uncharacterized cupin superfamily protein